MTRAFDVAAAKRVTPFDDDVVSGCLSSVDVVRCKVGVIRGAVVVGHYSGVMPDAVQDAFAAFDGDTLVGAVAYGPGGTSKTFGAIIEGHDTKNSRELVRLWIHPKMPKNSASLIVSRSLKQLPEQVGLVVSFADSGQGHSGFVYQALNFRYLGTTTRGKTYVDSDGVQVTPRLANIYRMRRPDEFGGCSDAEIRKSLGWREVISHPKHRYAIGIGKDRKRINVALDKKSLPYPKGRES